MTDMNNTTKIAGSADSAHYAVYMNVHSMKGTGMPIVLGKLLVAVLGSSDIAESWIERVCTGSYEHAWNSVGIQNICNINQCVRALYPDSAEVTITYSKEVCNEELDLVFEQELAGIGEQGL